MSHPTGEQYEIAFGRYRAVVTELGAGLRSLSADGRDVVSGFAADDPVSGGRGQTLLPWPNRIRDGRYTFAGRAQQLWLTEPARHNASHGLVRYVGWRLDEHREDAVASSIRVFPQPGWPGTLEARLTYRLDDAGLTVDLHVRNTGDVAVPFGYGAHPYLTVGEATVDEISLTVPADAYLEVDPERLLPVAVHPVFDTPYDLRSGRPIGERVLDTALTGLQPGDDGRWRVRAEREDRWAELWAGPGFAWTQVFTGGPHRDTGIAVEPMTCGPDAFNDGPTAGDVQVLEPGTAVDLQWGLAGG